jgi:TonB family protein
MKKGVVVMWMAAAAVFCVGVAGADGQGKESGGKAYTVNVSGKTIQRAIAPKTPPVNEAYKKRLLDKPDLAAGTIAVKFNIDGDGKVFYAVVAESTVRDEELENTILEIVKTWVFTKKDGLSGISEIVYTFSFEHWDK